MQLHTEPADSVATFGYPISGLQTQWRIHGRTGRPLPPLTKTWGWSMVARSSLLQTPGHRQVFIETLTFGHIFVRKWTKSVPLQGEFDPTLGALHLDPAGGSAPDPRLGSRSTRSPWSASHPLGKSWIRYCAKAIHSTKNKSVYKRRY